MNSRQFHLFVVIFVFTFLIVPVRADVLAVEDSASSPDVLRFATTGNHSIFTSIDLDAPIGIALDGSNNVYVVDEGQTSSSSHANSVAKYSSTGTPLGFYVTPSTAPGNTLNAPWDITFDSNNNGYVTSQTLPNPPFGYAAKYSSAGVFQSSFGTASLNLPTGVTYSAFNSLLYIINGAPTGAPGPNLNSILIYNPANIAAAPTIITPTGAGALDGAEEIAIDPTGDLFVASTGATTGIAKIQEYTAAGVYIRTLASVADGNSYGVAIDPATNTLYASFLNNGTNGTIEKYSTTTGIDLGLFATGLNNVAYLADAPALPEPTSLGLLSALACATLIRRKKR